MNKFFVFIIAFFAITGVSYAQNDIFVKGDKVIGAGIGFINTIHTGNGWKNASIPIYLTGEYGVVDGLIDGKASVGIGLDLGYAAFKYTPAALSYRYSNLRLGVRGAFHYQFADNWDTYAGLILGYDIVSGNDNYAVSKPFLGSCLGARYYFSNSFAAMAEIGHNVSLIKMGIAYKF
ncbi:MAG: hypothetical protein LBF59_02845 [Prevotellaceae bacterium]|jgi:hypothetical protein|nr:hypothetical protein [Prevotellaceae bacterium]